MTGIEFLNPNVVLYLHDVALSLYGGQNGLRDAGLLESAMLRASNKLAYVGSELMDVFDLAAAYAFGLAKNHAFNDGNKRTGWAAAVVFLELNGVEFAVPTGESIANMVSLATNVLSEDGFAAWLRSLFQPAAGDADL